MGIPFPDAGAEAGRRPFFGHLIGAAATVALATAVARPTGAPGGSESDRELIALCRAFEALEDRVDAFWSDGATPIANEDARDAMIAPLQDQQRALLISICALPATTIAGLVARAGMMLRWDGDMADDPGSEATWDRRMTAALLRDFRGGAGHGW